ncbi:MAG TPA: GNAT family N-acetyltransferase [Burkholderiaceae bacterium]|jgi:GNAT superfamily N-acetyltransferase
MTTTRHLSQSQLDNPAWSALTTKQAHLGQAGGLAVRYHPDVSPFAGLSHPTLEAFQHLRLLIPQGGHVLLQTVEPLPQMEGVHVENLFAVRQMVDIGEVRGVVEDAVLRLGAADVHAMMELAVETKPGPFGTRTHETGNYIGIRHDGHLVAMAGERMQCDGYTEISAVCVTARHRGKGIAGRLMNILRREIRGRGNVPFLHVRDDNSTAISLYANQGFETRQMFHLYRLSLTGI